MNENRPNLSEEMLDAKKPTTEEKDLELAEQAHGLYEDRILAEKEAEETKGQNPITEEGIEKAIEDIDGNKEKEGIKRENPITEEGIKEVIENIGEHEEKDET